MTDQKINLFQHLVLLTLVLAIILSLTACGRKNMPDRPTDSEYPRSYPSQ
jgi:predicted small lipoprotein YifL